MTFTAELKELEKQSVFYNEDEETWEFDREKFAELLIEKCAEIAHYLAPTDESAEEIRNGIKQYFGIK